MNRADMLARAESEREWDVVVIGGGASGLGVAVDAASRGLSTILLEANDFSQGTSSRSTKLVHGGVRYLEQGDIPLVLEALHERGLLHRNAPHLVRHQSFIVPNYQWWEGPFFGIGLKVYDMLAGKLNLAPSRHLSRLETIERIPNIETEGLLGGTEYFDGQFDDARLAVALARTAADHGAVVLNHSHVTGLLKNGGMTGGVTAVDDETGRELRLRGRVVINATGIFTDSVRRMDEAGTAPVVQPSQGVHLVLDRNFLRGDSAVMVPHTDDGRVLFVIPWHGRALVGTTDTPRDQPEWEPRPLAEEVDFLLRNAARYLARKPGPEDIRSWFAGQRPLVRPPGSDGTPTKSISRNHEVIVSPSGLVTLVGGKWTTYRKMAQDALDTALRMAGLPDRPCVTSSLPIHGHTTSSRTDDRLDVYGADAEGVRTLEKEHPDWAQPLHPQLPYSKAEIVWAARHEMARTVGDALARRTRALIYDATAAAEAAEPTARLMAAELGRHDDWVRAQTTEFLALAAGYRP